VNDWMRFFADVLVFFGAVLLTFGTDLVISTAGESSTLGGPLGVIASLIGVSLLTTGILNHYRLSRRAREDSR
jgi:TRAP-type C4-dicarboxylate transport system permease small subunit